MNRQKIEELTNELVEVANKYIDDYQMSTEDVYGSLCGAGFKVVQASIPAEAELGGIEENLG